MRYSGEHKARTRERVLREAAREIRAKGRENVGVAGIMARAGLTHGGFYAHFDSKESMIAEAIATMFSDARARSSAIAEAEDPREALRTYVDFYLSPAHRDGRDRGCPLPALSGDIARIDGAGRQQFGQGVAALSRRLADALVAAGRPDAEAAASAMLSQMVGAVALARATEGPQSDAILEDARSAILGAYGLEART